MDDSVLEFITNFKDNTASKGVHKAVVGDGAANENTYDLAPVKEQLNNAPQKQQPAKLNNFEPRFIQNNEQLPTTRANVDCDFKEGSARVETYLKKNDNDFHKPNPSTFLGYSFQQSKQACFKLEFVNIENKLALVCYRMEGDAFLLTNFFDGLKKGCSWDEKTEDDDDAWFDDEDEDDDDDELFQQLKSNEFYLKMENDPELMKTWLSNLDGDCSADDVKSTLLLMAWNIKRETNLKEMQKHQKEFVASLLAFLKKPNVSLPEAQCCCTILRTLLAAKSDTYKLSTEEQIVLVESLVQWSTVSKRENSFSLPVPVSNNIQVLISSIFASIVLSLPKESLNDVEQVGKNAGHQGVITNLAKV